MAVFNREKAAAGESVYVQMRHVKLVNGKQKTLGTKNVTVKNKSLEKVRAVIEKAFKAEFAE